ncbi:MAG: heparinase II/III family protein [Candidatus Didemnitutus sp.]|nr:heparinase II/III family protein [Candidatus Didemnitutus sp.]
MRTFNQYFDLIRYMGSGWLLYRAGYAMRRRFGLLRRSSPAVTWEQVPAPELRLSPRAGLAVRTAWGRACVDEAEAILKGEFQLFSHRVVKAGFPPDWHRNQSTAGGGRRTEGGGQRAEGERQMSDVRRRSSELHWSEISDFGGGDIKGVWELSRFAWAFALARAYARTGDARFTEEFWQLFADWCRHNPPNTGPNWMCGQEATFRLMAVIFAAERLGVPVEQRELLARFVVATGRRINANLDYALSQKNNHGVSECVGLITTALLLPEHGQSAGWLSRGLRELREQLAELVYEDGGFSQHSLIYHRVLLHDLCWCRHRLEMAGQGSPAWLDAAGKRALVFLMTVTDPVTGQAPLYGSNDGANVLPLAEAGFLDMRPVIQMAAAVFRDELLLPPGPWDEAAAWLKSEWNTLPRVPWPVTPARWHAAEAGCFQIINGRDRLFLRCPTRFRHRPAQADMLHADIWHGGRPIAHDGGSFSYNSTERFTVLGTAGEHNVLTVDGREPLKKFSRFLYLPWPAGQAGESGPSAFRASHDGYTGVGIKWTREVSRSAQGAGFAVRDKVTGAAGRTLRWHWRLADLPWEMKGQAGRVETLDYRVGWTGPANARSSLLRADEATARGWWSPYYGSVEPAVSLLIEMEASGDVELVTEFSPLVD